MTNTTTNAIVTAASEDVQTQKFGKRKVAKVNLNGIEQKIWGNANDPILCQIQVGNLVQLLPAGKGWKIVNILHQQTPPTASTVQPTAAPLGWVEPAETVKEDIRSYIDTETKLYARIFGMVCNQMGKHELRDEQLTSISTSIFIATNRKFSI